jgi:hypothetical protein
MAGRCGEWRFRPDLYFRTLGAWDSPIIELPKPTVVAVVRSPDPVIEAEWNRITHPMPKPKVDHAGAALTKNFAEFLIHHPDVGDRQTRSPSAVAELPPPVANSVDGSKAKKTVLIRFRFKHMERIREVEMPVVPRVGDFVQGTAPGSGLYRVESVVFGINKALRSCTEIVVNLGS